MIIMTNLDIGAKEKLSQLKTGLSVSESLNGLRKHEKIEKLLIVMLDCSYSMGETMRDNSKLDTAWKIFQHDLEPNLSNWTYGVLTFGNHAEWLIFPTPSDTALSKNIEPSLYGSTSLGQALIMTWDYISNNAVSSRIILLTDGEPTDMTKPNILEMTKGNSSIPIDTVAIGQGENYDPVFLRELSRITGGIFSEAGSAEVLKDVIVKLSPVQRPLLGAVK